MKLIRLLQTTAAVIGGFMHPLTVHGQTFYFSSPLTSSGTEVDLSFGSGSDGYGGTTFGTLTETLYYDPVAKTLRQVGSVTINPTSRSINMTDPHGFYGHATGNAVLFINGGGNNLPFDTGVQPLYGSTLSASWVLVLPISGYCTVLHNGQSDSGPLSYSFGIPLLTRILATDSTSLTLSQSTGSGQFNGAQQGRAVANIGGLNLYDSTSDGTYYYSWQLNATTALAIPNPVISQQPGNQTVAAGGTAQFNVGASGTPTPTFQWLVNGTNLMNGGRFNGVTNASLTISNVQLTDLGSYSVIVSNLYGSATSSVVTLTVIGPVSPTTSIIAWGDSGYSQTNIPIGLSNVVKIAAGVYHSLALKTDGTVIAWGENDFGQTNPPAGLGNVTVIAAGWGTSLALKNDGTMKHWGWSDYGQDTNAAALSNLWQVAATWDCDMALKYNRTILVWGKSTHEETNVPTWFNDTIAIAGGGYHCLALRSNGMVVVWGDNGFGQTNVPAGLNGVKAIAGGGGHCLALRTNGTVVAWGNNTYGQINVPASLTNAIAISAGYYHSLALRSDGRVLAWGSNTNGQTSIPANLSNVVAIAAGGFHNLALIGNLASPIKFTGVTRLANGNIQFTVNGSPGDIYRMLGSSNMVDWLTLGSATNVTGAVQFIDSNATNFSQRFYRVVMP